MSATHPAAADSAALLPVAAAAMPTSDLADLSLTGGSPSLPPPIELRFLLDNAAVGGIIGRGGESVRKVREDSGAFVSIVKADYRHVQERIMVLKGTVEQIASAAKGIAQLLIDTLSRREDRPVDSATLRLLIHKSGVGAVLGRGGATVKEIREESGSRVQVSNETLPNSSEKVVSVTGSADQVYTAMLRIAQQLQINPLKPGTKVFPYVPGNAVYAAAPPFGAPVAYPQSHAHPHAHAHPQSQQHAMHPMYNGSAAGLASAGPSGQQQFGGLLRPQAPAMTLSTQKIAIPTICCGSIIGKGGSVIKQLREQSGTNISISDPDDATPNERVVTLAGTPASISHAVYLIRQLVEAYSPNSQQSAQNGAQPQQNGVQQQAQQATQPQGQPQVY